MSSIRLITMIDQSKKSYPFNGLFLKSIDLGHMYKPKLSFSPFEGCTYPI